MNPKSVYIAVFLLSCGQEVQPSGSKPELRVSPVLDFRYVKDDKEVTFDESASQMTIRNYSSRKIIEVIEIELKKDPEYSIAFSDSTELSLTGKVVGTFPQGDRIVTSCYKADSYNLSLKEESTKKSLDLQGQLTGRGCD